MPKILWNWKLIEILPSLLNSFWIPCVFSSRVNYYLLLWCKWKWIRKKEEWFLSFKILMKKVVKLVFRISTLWRTCWVSKKIRFLKKLLNCWNPIWVREKIGSLKRPENKSLKPLLVLWLGLLLSMNIMKNPRSWSPNKPSWWFRRVNSKWLMLNWKNHKLNCNKLRLIWVNWMKNSENKCPRNKFWKTKQAKLRRKSILQELWFLLWLMNETVGLNSLLKSGNKNEDWLVIALWLPPLFLIVDLSMLNSVLFSKTNISLEIWKRKEFLWLPL